MPGTKYPVCAAEWVYVGSVEYGYSKGKAPPTESDKDFFSREELSQGKRLSCRVEVEDDLVLDVPSLAEGKGRRGDCQSRDG